MPTSWNEVDQFQENCQSPPAVGAPTRESSQRGPDDELDLERDRRLDQQNCSAKSTSRRIRCDKMNCVRHLSRQLRKTLLKQAEMVRGQRPSADVWVDMGDTACKVPLSHSLHRESRVDGPRRQEAKNHQVLKAVANGFEAAGFARIRPASEVLRLQLRVWKPLLDTMLPVVSLRAHHDHTILNPPHALQLLAARCLQQLLQIIRGHGPLYDQYAVGPLELEAFHPPMEGRVMNQQVPALVAAERSLNNAIRCPFRRWLRASIDKI